MENKEEEKVQSERLKEYRQHLILAEQKSQEDYDKTVLSLSGGALGISFAFIKDIVGQGPFCWPALLPLSWISWGLSSTCVLASFYFSQQALRFAVNQVDQDKIDGYLPGGKYAKATSRLNAIGGILFLIGIVAITTFVSINYGRR